MTSYRPHPKLNRFVGRTAAAAAVLAMITTGFAAPAVHAAGPAPASVKAAKPVAIAAPTGLSGVAGDKSATLTWTPTTGAVSYRLFRDYNLIGYPTSATFTDTGLTNGTDYKYYVRAVSSTGAISDASASVTVRPVAPTISAPTGLSGVAGDKSATLTWTPTTGAVSYRLFRDYNLIGYPTSATFTDTGLINGTDYNYYVRAVGSTGVISDPSSTVTVTPKSSLAIPTAPVGLVGTAGDTKASLTWTATTGADSYVVLRNGVQAGTSVTPAFTDSGLTNGTSYTYAVKAVNAAGTSPASASVSVTPKATVVAPATPPARLAWFYKPPSSTNEPTVLKEFDTFILTKGDESFVSRVRSARPEAKINQYFLLNQVVKPDSGSVEWRNNAANQPGDFNDLWTNHYDWFLKDTSGQPIHDSAGKFYMMDPGNDQWRSYWLTKFKASNVGWDGLFLDNVDLSLISVERYGVRARDYSTDDAFTNAIAGFLTRIRNEYALPSGKPMAGNLINGSSSRDATPKYRDLLDGYMEEAFAADWHTGYLSATAWERQLARVESFTAGGKAPILVTQSDSQTDTNRQQFTFASYLLVSGPTVSFRFTRSGAYGTPWIYDNYSAALGNPLGARRTLSDGTVRRDFEHGYVVVNPSARSSSIVVQ